MRSKVIAALVAGGLLVGAGFITTIVSSPSVASAQEETDAPEEQGLMGRGMEFLGDVLSDLVSEGTIEQADADAVLNAVEAKAGEIRAEREAQREIIEAALEDGVITEDEVSDLPEDHPLFGDRLDEAWEDGELTKEELGEFRHPRRHDFKRGARFGALLDDGGIDADEYAALGDDHPLKTAEVEELLDGDGLITLEELRELRQQSMTDSQADTPDA
ncbi:MAG: hypothetical protein U9N56_07810 [Actinomycetota bacterium]|nr:hypothetical protein [Actinomycetota bacterium]